MVERPPLWAAGGRRTDEAILGAAILCGCVYLARRLSVGSGLAHSFTLRRRPGETVTAAVKREMGPQADPVEDLLERAGPDDEPLSDADRSAIEEAGGE